MENQDPQEDQRKITVHYSTTRNLGNFQKAEFSVYLSGIRPDATSEEVGEMIDQAEFVFARLRHVVDKKISEVQAEAKEAQVPPGRPIPPRTPQSTQQSQQNRVNREAYERFTR